MYISTSIPYGKFPLKPLFGWSAAWAHFLAGLWLAEVKSEYSLVEFWDWFLSAGTDGNFQLLFITRSLLFPYGIIIFMRKAFYSVCLFICIYPSRGNSHSRWSDVICTTPNFICAVNIVLLACIMWLQFVSVPKSWLCNPGRINWSISCLFRPTWKTILWHQCQFSLLEWSLVSRVHPLIMRQTWSRSHFVKC